MVEQLLLTVLASAIGTAIAGAIGIRYGLSKLKKERAFEKRLHWYEEAVKTLLDGAERIEAGIRYSREERDSHFPFDLPKYVEPPLSRVVRLRFEAELYASASAHEAVVEAVEQVTLLASMKEPPTLGSPPGAPRPIVTMLVIVSKMMRHAASRLADDVREHLELEPITRPMGLYDREYREHLKDLEEKGLWPPPGEQPPSLVSAADEPRTP